MAETTALPLSPLTAVSPVDGRYHSKTAALAPYFSELGLIRYRVAVEVEWLKALAMAIPAKVQVPDGIDLIVEGFTEADARRVKEIESVTNHDVKAVEYFIKEWLEGRGHGDVKEWVHFGLTSQDINNTAFPMMLNEALSHVVMPAMQRLVEKLSELASEWVDIPMLARTHGQPASPTRLGKEVKVYVERLQQQMRLLDEVPRTGKFGGATGNFNAHHAAFPEVDWVTVANGMYERLGLCREQVTTQISNYDNLAALLDALSRLSMILIDLDRDMWMYISMDYFKQRIKAGEVGSSAMPHKVNPIDFENSEGNLGVAAALLTHLARKLPVSRLQRDLTDSTVIRNLGVPLAHMLISIESTLKGLNKLILNREKIDADLEAAWSVVAEGIQTILRREHYPNPYEALKGLTRVNTRVDGNVIATFIDSLEGISDSVKDELRALTPATYTGL